MTATSRREFLQRSAGFMTSAGLMASAGVAGWGLVPQIASGQEAGFRPKRPEGVEVINPRARVPLSFIVDDSTCLVNMAYYAMPQFAEAWPERAEAYSHPWQTWPREIPDSFVKRFGEWSAEHGVKGKYSIVPWPSYVGRLDYRLPGWSTQQLRKSIELVQTLMLPNWDIHPEMITHTWVLDLKTGLPLRKDGGGFWMENTGWTPGKSVEELAEYTAYALRILKNIDLPCEGFTTPGGFGNGANAALSEASCIAVRDVYGSEIPHYFKYVETGDASTQPRVESVRRSADGKSYDLTVSIIAGTGDWFCGWDGTDTGSTDRFITADGQGGRLPELIARDEPAIMLCHWPGLWVNGQETGYRIYQEAVTRLNEHHGSRAQWMRLNEMARYWATKELIRWEVSPDGVALIEIPFDCPDLTLRIAGVADKAREKGIRRITTTREGKTERPLEALRGREQLSGDAVAGRYVVEGDDALVCLNVTRGSLVELRLGK
jgi:hypothetical protein